MISANLPRIPTFDDWRDAARNMLAVLAKPEEVVWRTEGDTDLFMSAPTPNLRPVTPIYVPRAFIDIAGKAALHSDPQRFALLYRVLWRLQQNRALLEDAADRDVVHLNALAKAVRRDEHKMHAFVRFKEIAGADGPRYVAWFEPQHHIVHETADFFVRRFTGMNWSIITPKASAHWDGETLSFGPGGKRSDVPADDARDDDWRTYYESMFNPARLKVAAMKREMPKHYWRNMPETELIPDLIKSASTRTVDMVVATPTTPRKRAGAAHAKIAPEDLPTRLEPIAERAAAPASLDDLKRALQSCRACQLWRDATQAVPGEGASEEPLLALVGEQPGDQEDLAGHPFVGPAGQVLNRALAEAGIDRGELFVTNAVKHFKHEPRGKRRLHKGPNAGEVEICRWWVAHELKLVKPRLVVALGATALQSLSTFKGTLTNAREQTLQTREGAPLRATVHPSYLLRLPDEEVKVVEFERFVADLKDAKRLAEQLAHAA
ncbi:MAG: UdgX family uracil-DNA binding protein [Terricaulis sp.]